MFCVGANVDSVRGGGGGGGGGGETTLGELVGQDVESGVVGENLNPHYDANGEIIRRR